MHVYPTIGNISVHEKKRLINFNIIHLAITLQRIININLPKALLLWLWSLNVMCEGVTAHKDWLQTDMNFKDCYLGRGDDVVSSGERHSNKGLHSIKGYIYFNWYIL